MTTVIIVAFACLVVRWMGLTEVRIAALHLKPLAIVSLAAAAITHTQDILNDLLLAGPMFGVYLGYIVILRRIRPVRQHPAA